MATPYEDLLVDLAACLCLALTPEGEDDPGFCFCGVLPGNAIPAYVGFDCDTCGMAWVRLDNAYPATSLGQPLENPNSCGAFIGLDIELGVMRCVAQQDADDPPPAAELQDLASQQIRDMLAMRSAVACCDALDDIDYALGTFTPTGPQGGVVAYTWNLSVIL